MIVSDSEIGQYLDDFKNDKIAQGKGIGIHQVDDYLRFKKGTFNIIFGHDNMGKTYWRTWYYLVLSVKYNYKWCVWTGENKAGQIVRDLIQFYTGKRLKQLSITEIYRYQAEMSQWFSFVNNKKTWKYSELLKVFEDEPYNGCLIDPYTGLDRKYGHSDNYEFLNNTREWVNKHECTIDVCTHPSSASGRMQGMYPKGHEWEGHLKEPFKADVEGGKPFANRCDDFYIIHRLPKHPTMKTFTLVYVDKIKETETGGKQTEINLPICFEFNKGLGFTIADINPITNSFQKQVDEQIKIEPNLEFTDKDNDFLNSKDDQPF